MAHHPATAHQLDLAYDTPSRPPSSAAAVLATVPAPGRPVPLCVICGRVPVQVILKPTGAGRLRPAGLCLRCRHAVRQQRRMARAERVRDPAPGRAPAGGLIVPRSSRLTGERKYRQLTRSRRRAQKAARRALKH